MRPRGRLLLLAVSPVLAVAAAVGLLSTGCRPAAGRACTFGQATCTDDRSGLFCGAAGRYLAFACRGRDGCQQEGARVWCDQSSASAGEPCTPPGFACSADAKSSLSCREGTFVVAQPCAGPYGCRVAPFDGLSPRGAGSVLCDNDVSAEGDPCLDEGDYACTADMTVALKCAGKRMVAVRACNGPKGCRVTHPKAKDSDLACDELGDGGGY